MSQDRILIFDTTLRDGEQSPGVSLTPDEKLTIAQQLAKLNVDIIEAGFPISSKGDFNAVQKIAKNVKGHVIAALARTTKKDIQTAWQAIKDAEKPRIHTFIATSDIHLKHRLKLTRDAVLQKAKDAISYAKTLCDDIEFSAEDATRSAPDYLCQIIKTAIMAGATTINIPDTVGYAMPDKFIKLLLYIISRVPNLPDITLSVHCHNDLGLAVANSLAALKVGVRQVECAINGLGERAGNAALEEIVMAILTRKDIFTTSTKIKTDEIMRTSQLVSHLTGIPVQPNKAIVGKNALRHESGIHAHGVLNEKTTYEIITPESIGLKESSIVLGKHSGRHALNDKLKKMGYKLTNDQVDAVFEKFKALCDKKKTVFDEDLQLIVEEVTNTIPKIYIFKNCKRLNSVNDKTNYQVTLLVKQIHQKSTPYYTDKRSNTGDGTVDAIYNAIDRITGIQSKLMGYNVNSVTEGKDAQAVTHIQVKFNGKIIQGRASHPDVIESSALAYINALNRFLYYHK
ncbi:2-isopropylmalate synthase [Patescibacteria group bacterium]